MKKIYLLITLVTLGYAASAQLDVKLNALGLINKKVDIGAEIGTDKSSIELMAGLNFKPWGDGIEINGEKIEVPRFGFNTGARFNYYFNPNESLDGWFASPYVNYRNETLKMTDQMGEKVKHNRLTTGVVIGRKGMITDRLGYLVEMGGGYSLLYGYKNKMTKEKVELEESIPFLSSLVKVDLPFRVSLVYRIVEN